MSSALIYHLDLFFSDIETNDALGLAFFLLYEC